MNYICLSPNFPPNYEHFTQRLSTRGANVLGIGSDPYDNLTASLKNALTEYYRVDDLEDYQHLLKACGYYTHKYGRINRIESHNEHWLGYDAQLRTDFNVVGFKDQDMTKIKYKSNMKTIFQQIGIPVARGRVVNTLEEGQQLIKETGYPVCAKPDSGVGASHTYKLHNENDLIHFFETKPPVAYIMEEFIDGEIHTFDGLTDGEGNVVFCNTFIFDKGVMETVNDNLDMMYYSLRQIPEDMMAYGLRTVKAFGLKERFFHIEFFRTAAGKLIALEINVRPPGGWSMDIFNYATNEDLYDQYAQMVMGSPVKVMEEKPYFVGYAGRKETQGVHYRHSPEEILNRWGDKLVHQGSIHSVFASAIGNYGYVMRSPNLEDIKEATTYILERSKSF